MLERILSLSAASVNTLVSVVWKSAMVDNVTLIFVLYSGTTEHKPQGSGHIIVFDSWIGSCFGSARKII